MARVTLHVDDQVLSKFRSSVLQRRGTLKALSKEVEESLKSTLDEEDVLPYLARVKASFNPRTRARPERKGPAAEVRFEE